MQYTDEQYIAKKAEQMLTSAIRRKTASFKAHYNKKAGEPSLKDAFAQAKTKKYGRKRDGNQRIFMRSLVLKMARHGFVQHYGVDTIRAGGFRERTRPKNTTYEYEPHDFHLKEKPFINEAIKQSKVVDFVASHVAEFRSQKFGEELVFYLSNFF